MSYLLYHEILGQNTKQQFQIVQYSRKDDLECITGVGEGFYTENVKYCRVGIICILLKSMHEGCALTLFSSPRHIQEWLIMTMGLGAQGMDIIVDFHLVPFCMVYCF